jgi:tetratricopeptide (TPR) repeat protein
MVVSGTIDGFPDTVRAQIQILDAAHGNLPYRFQVDGSPADLGAFVAAVATRVTGRVAVSLDESYPSIGPAARDGLAHIHYAPTLEAFRVFRRGSDIFLDGDWPQALQHFRDAFALDTTFLTPVVSMLGAYGNMEQTAAVDSLLRFLAPRRGRLSLGEALWTEWFQASLNGDNGRKLAVSRDLMELVPTNGYILALSALHTGQPEVALEGLREADPEHPWAAEWAPYWIVLARAHHHLGNYGEELEAAREGRGRFPNNLRLLSLEAQAQAALGRIPEIRELMEEARGIRSPRTTLNAGTVLVVTAAQLLRFGYAEEALRMANEAVTWHQDPASDADPETLARAFLLANQPLQARPVVRSLAHEDPDNFYYRGLEGVVLALTEDQEGAKAAQSWLGDLQHPYPYLRGRSRYWEAAIQANLGSKAEAVRLLRQSLSEGYWNVTPSRALGDDPLLRPLWGYEPFEELVSPKR